MRYSIVFLIGLISFAIEGKDVASKVDHVTIFLNQAEVHRIAKTKIASSTTELIFTGLSNQIDANSIQLKGKGNFVIMGTSFRHNYLVGDEPTGEIKVLKDAIEVKNRIISTLSSRLSVLDAEEDLIKSNKIIGGSEANVTAEELETMAAYYRTRLLAIHQERYDVKTDLESEKIDLKKLKDQLNQESSSKKKVAGEVVVEIANSKYQDIALELTYMVRGAYWKPSYDLRADASLTDLQLIYKAAISQNTGEQWDNVKVSLSTNNPISGTAMPVLNPWYLDFVKQIQYKKKQALMRSDMAMSANVEMTEDVMMDEAYDFPQVNESLIAVNYDISIPTSIKSNGKPTVVTVRNERISADFLYQSVPKISDKVYLIAKTKDWQSLDLLAGYLNVFYDGGFINKTYINPDQNLKEMNISFGVDQAVTIDHKSVKDFTDDQNIGSKRTVAFEYEISVLNNKAKTVKLEVFDQIPVSQNDAIEVNDIVLDGGESDRVTGEVKWSFDLGSKMSKNWKYGYEVKYPRDEKIRGL